MSILIQDELRGGRSIKEIADRLHLHLSYHGRYKNLVQVKYDQIESPMGDPLVQQCRGIVLDQADNWRCVARPFDKFFNHGEGHAAPIDWPSARVQEKVDGSLIIAYWYEGSWHVATSGTCDASGVVNGMSFNFAQLFWRTMGERGYKLPVACPDHFLTFMFELTTPYNRVVVRHEGCDVTLLGARDPYDGHEVDVRLLHGHGLPPPVRHFELGSIDSVISTFATMEPLKQEGYVVVDKGFRRVKVKHPGYVALHHLRDGMGPRRLLEVIRAGESSEFLTYYPEWERPFSEIKCRFENLVGAMEVEWDVHKGVEDRKSFALAIQRAPFPGALFALRDGRTPSIRRWLADVNIKHLAQHLDIKDVEF